MVDALRADDAYAGTPDNDLRGPLYRLALRRALASGAAHVHYLDFDRVLHWLGHRGREPDRVVRLADPRDVVLVGRTLRAHRSHQRALWTTEEDVNAALAAGLGLRGRVDFLAPSFIARGPVVAALLARSRARGSTIYGELPALLAALAPRMAYIECAGLDWETPDRFRAEVRRIGLARWRAKLDNPDEWRLRRALAADILRGFTRALRRYPARRVHLARAAVTAPELAAPRSGARRRPRT